MQIRVVRCTYLSKILYRNLRVCSFGMSIAILVRLQVSGTNTTIRRVAELETLTFRNSYSPAAKNLKSSHWC
jgi:hypothetical protein